MRIKTFRVEKMIIWKINDLLNNLADGPLIFRAVFISRTHPVKC